MVKCSNCLLVLWWRQVMGGEGGKEETIIFLDHPAMMMIILIIIATNIVIIISGTHSTFYHPFIHLIKLKHLAARIRKSLAFLKGLKIWVSKCLSWCQHFVFCGNWILTAIFGILATIVNISDSHRQVRPASLARELSGKQFGAIFAEECTGRHQSCGPLKLSANIFISQWIITLKNYRDWCL